MAFKVRANRIQSGGYALSYGKGNKKLRAFMYKHQQGWLYNFDEESPYFHQSKPFPSARECKESWGVWAEAKYKNGSSNAAGESDLSTSKPPPPLSDEEKKEQYQKLLDSKRVSPPFYMPKKPPSYTPPVSSVQTPLEMLIEIQLWGHRHKKRIAEIVSHLPEQEDAFKSNPFILVLDGLTEIIAHAKQEAQHARTRV